MTAFEILEDISHKNNGLILSKSAIKEGISRTTLSQLCQAGRIIRIASGQYILPDELIDEMSSLGLRSKFIVFSHESALFLNGISERTPFVHTVTIPSSKTLSCSLRRDCKIYYIKDDLYDLGRIKLVTPMGNEVWAYDIDRTICDIIKWRNRISEETFISSLKLYVKNPNKNLSTLGEYAEKMGVLNKVRHYLEVLI